MLITARRDAGLTQQAVADKLGRPQSFVAKVEGRERRLDVLEFLQLAEAVDVDPSTIIGNARTAMKNKNRSNR